MNRNNTTPQTIGQRIAYLTQKKGLTQTELGNLLHQRREIVSYWENGSRDIKSGDIVLLADVLDTTCDYILRGIQSGNVDIFKATGLSNDSVDLLRGDPRASKVVNFLSAQHMVALETLEDSERNGDDYVESILELLNDFLLICDSKKDVLISLTSSYNITGEVILDNIVKDIEFISQEEPIKDEFGRVSLARYIAMDKLQTIEAILAEYLERKYFKNVFARKILMSRANSEGNHEES